LMRITDVDEIGELIESELTILEIIEGV
jgi:hypothetical protein